MSVQFNCCVYLPLIVSCARSHSPPRPETVYFYSHGAAVVNKSIGRSNTSFILGFGNGAGLHPHFQQLALIFQKLRSANVKFSSEASVLCKAVVSSQKEDQTCPDRSTHAHRHAGDLTTACHTFPTATTGS